MPLAHIDLPKEELDNLRERLGSKDFNDCPRYLNSDAIQLVYALGQVSGGTFTFESTDPNIVQFGDAAPVHYTGVGLEATIMSRSTTLEGNICDTGKIGILDYLHILVHHLTNDAAVKWTIELKTSTNLSLLRAEVLIPSFGLGQASEQEFSLVYDRYDRLFNHGMQLTSDSNWQKIKNLFFCNHNDIVGGDNQTCLIARAAREIILPPSTVAAEPTLILTVDNDKEDWDTEDAVQIGYQTTNTKYYTVA